MDEVRGALFVLEESEAPRRPRDLVARGLIRPLSLSKHRAQRGRGLPLRLPRQGIDDCPPELGSRRIFCGYGEQRRHRPRLRPAKQRERRGRPRSCRLCKGGEKGVRGVLPSYFSERFGGVRGGLHVRIPERRDEEAQEARVAREPVSYT